MPSPRRQWCAFAYFACLATFTIAVAHFGDRHTGYTSLIQFGERFARWRLPQLADVPLYTYARQEGYDGQFYAQIAVAGNPFDPALTRALDAPGYRQRRVLLPIVVHALGVGNPAAIVQIYALANLACLLCLATLLALWWFPPTGVDNLLRWGGTVFSVGMVVSTTRSLTDGPAFLLLVVAGRLVERRRIWCGSLVLALAGLARETSVLAAAAFWPERRTASDLRRAVLAAAVCIGPTAVWMLVLHHHYGQLSDLRNLALPWSAMVSKVRDLVDHCRAHGFDMAFRDEMLIGGGLGLQIAFFAFQPRREQPWWRIGTIFAAFSAVLGWPVWEGFPSAAARVLLPLTFSFNRLVPRTRNGLVLLIAGNLGVLTVPDLFASCVPTEQVVFAGGVEANYVEGWFAPEHAGRATWRWSTGTATLTLENPSSDPRTISLDFGLRSETQRTVTVAAESGDPARTFILQPRRRLTVHLGPFSLQRGGTNIFFSTGEPSWTEPGPARRPLAFAIDDLYLMATLAVER